jgi:hypothetical protein
VRNDGSVSGDSVNKIDVQISTLESAGEALIKTRGINAGANAVLISLARYFEICSENFVSEGQAYAMIRVKRNVSGS